MNIDGPRIGLWCFLACSVGFAAGSRFQLHKDIQEVDKAMDKVGQTLKDYGCTCPMKEGHK